MAKSKTRSKKPLVESPYTVTQVDNRGQATYPSTPPVKRKLQMPKYDINLKPSVTASNTPEAIARKNTDALRKEGYSEKVLNYSRKANEYFENGLSNTLQAVGPPALGASLSALDVVNDLTRKEYAQVPVDALSGYVKVPIGTKSVHTPNMYKGFDLGKPSVVKKMLPLGRGIDAAEAVYSFKKAKDYTDSAEKYLNQQLYSDSLRDDLQKKVQNQEYQPNTKGEQKFRDGGPILTTPYTVSTVDSNPSTHSTVSDTEVAKASNILESKEWKTKNLSNRTKSTTPVSKITYKKLDDSSYQNIHRYNGKTEFECKGKGCAEQVHSELQNIGYDPTKYSTDAWFTSDAVQKAGGSTVDWKNYKNVKVGDVLSMDRPGEHYQTEIKNNPNKYKAEKSVEHLGIVVGFDEKGIPLIKHGGKEEKTVVQPITNLSLQAPVGTLNYTPSTMVRVPNNTGKVSDDYFRINHARIDNLPAPIAFENTKYTAKDKKFIEAQNKNLEQQTKVLGIDPKTTQELQRMSFAIFKKESNGGQSKLANVKESLSGLKKYPSLGPTRLKYDMFTNSSVGNSMNNLGVSKERLAYGRDYNDVVNATMSVLGSQYKTQSKSADKNNLRFGVPIENIIQKSYNAPSLRNDSAYFNTPENNYYTKMGNKLSKDAGIRPAQFVNGGEVTPLQNTNINDYTMRKYKNGGRLTMCENGGALDPSDAAISRVLAFRNQSREAMQRAMDPNQPSLQSNSMGEPRLKNLPNSQRSTHYMAYDLDKTGSNPVVYPTINMTPSGLKYNGFEGARNAGNVMPMPSNRVADMFSDTGYKVGTGMNKRELGGYVRNLGIINDERNWLTPKPPPVSNKKSMGVDVYGVSAGNTRFEEGGDTEEEKLNRTVDGVSEGLGLAATGLSALNPLSEAGQYGQYDRKDRGRMASTSALSGASMGLKLGANPALVAATGGLSLAAGAALGAIAGGVGGAVMARKRERDKAKQIAKDQAAYQDRATASLNFNNNVGVDNTAMYADGGLMKRPLAAAMMNRQNSNMKPMSENATEVKGRSHAEGGESLPDLGAEVEAGETTEGSYVFSKKLGFADLHRPLARAMGKIEKKPMTPDRVNALRLLQGKVEMLKAQQEQVRKQLNLA